MPDFLQLTGKTFVVLGVANKKSVAWFIAQMLEEQGAKVVYSVRSAARKKSLEAQLAGAGFEHDCAHEACLCEALACVRRRLRRLARDRARGIAPAADDL